MLFSQFANSIPYSSLKTQATLSSSQVLSSVLTISEMCRCGILLYPSICLPNKNTNIRIGFSVGSCIRKTSNFNSERNFADVLTRGPTQSYSGPG